MKEGGETVLSRQPWPWLFCFAYAIHLADEYLLPPGLAPWAVRHFDILFSESIWIAVNVPSFLLLTLAVWLVARGSWPPWVLLTLAVHIALHAAMHLVASLWVPSFSPGLASGLIVAAPLAAWTGVWAVNALPRRTLLLAALLGVASFQPLLDVVVRFVLGLPWWAS